ncbi:DUF4188 domain-containing protein [Hazenella sp. IB182357]|uniref:DUF4188 domain-containing protein n=1 Tax=Polycladospora coralii TaxID=2771432 RepID=A0A926NDI3_9BACL|nr:DUF4188 domain-containing protein [Polycladospora coralii]
MHATAWKTFNQKVNHNDAVGIFHETLSSHKKCIRVHLHQHADNGFNTVVTSDQDTARKRIAK